MHIIISGLLSAYVGWLWAQSSAPYSFGDIANWQACPSYVGGLSPKMLILYYRGIAFSNSGA